MRTRGAWAALLVGFVAGCGDPGPATPSSQTFAISGVVSRQQAGGTAPVAGARVEIVSGQSRGQHADTDTLGRYRLDAVPVGTHLIRATANGFLPAIDNVNVTGDRTLDFAVVPAEFVTQVRVLDLFTGQPVANGSVTGGVAPTFSDADGRFAAVLVQSGGSSEAPVTIAHHTTHTRQTRIRIPGADVELRLIPSSFDLTAFDQLCRHPVLRRWVTAPRLIVVASQLDFTTAGAESYDVTSIVGYTDDEVEVLVETLTNALRVLTGNAFPEFADVQVDRPPPGARVMILNDGAITVARFGGLSARAPASGYGRWLSGENFSVTGGAMLLDHGHDLTPEFARHLRGHELGHALGYSHVTAVHSIMTPGLFVNFTPFDHQAGLVAFSRAPGSQSPDADPDPLPASAVLSAPAGRWSVPVK